MKQFALAHADGRISISQLVGDAGIECLEKMKFKSPVVKVWPVNDEEARAIRAARPKAVRSSEPPVAEFHPQPAHNGASINDIREWLSVFAQGIEQRDAAFAELVARVGEIQMTLDFVVANAMAQVDMVKEDG